MSNIIMLDIETTGLNVDTDDVISIGMAKLEFDGHEYTVLETREIVCHSDKQPSDDFARMYLTQLYERANVEPVRSPAEIRSFILGFTGENPTIVGWNVANFDLPFLIRACMLQRNDYNYRVYEMSGVLHFVAAALGQSREYVIKEAQCDGVLRHDAVDDCLGQTRVLNRLLKMIKAVK